MRKRVAIFFLSKPNFDEYACKYMVLNLNRLQTCFEFEFPEVPEEYLYQFPKIGHFKVDKLLAELSRIVDELRKPKRYWQSQDIDYFIGITSVKMSDGQTRNLFWQVEDNMAIITTYTWRKLFSPPSVFEYIIHAIAGSLAQMSVETQMPEKVPRHRQTRGCFLDFTYYKKDDKVDISLGYICDECMSKIEEVLGEAFAFCFKKMCSRDWIGETEEVGSVAYNLLKFFKVNISKDTGFYKTFWEKAKEHLPEVPKEIFIAIITAVLTYIFTR